MLPTRRPRALNLDVEASRSVVIAIWLSHVWEDSARGQDTGDGGHNDGCCLLNPLHPASTSWRGDDNSDLSSRFVERRELGTILGVVGTREFSGGKE